MNAIVCLPVAESEARHFQAGGLDAYGLKPERHRSDGNGIPCRHCLRNVEAGEDYLVLAYRPFPSLQPYAETGPIFLHSDPRARLNRQIRPAGGAGRRAVSPRRRRKRGGRSSQAARTARGSAIS
jgi:hypothetical protein